jgi:hypothetical protein
MSAGGKAKNDAEALRRRSNPAFAAQFHDITDDTVRDSSHEAESHEISDRTLYAEDPVFNMMDSYSAMLCAAFMHCKIFDKLCHIGTHSSVRLSGKSQKLLVNLLRIVSTIFPDSVSSELLTVPKLIENSTVSMSASQGDILESLISSNRATSILESLANTFASTKLLLPESTLVTLKPELGAPGLKRSASNSLLDREVMTSGFSRHSNTARSVTEISEDVTKYSLSRQQRPVTDLDSYLEDRSSTGLTDIEYNRLKEKSNVLSKDKSNVLGQTDGKDPNKWDWIAIGDIFDFAFTPPRGDYRFNMLLRQEIQWVQRLSGYFRCSSETDKAYFANL